MSRKLSYKGRSRLRRHKRKLISWRMLSWKSKLEFMRCWRRCASKDLIDETAEAQRVLEKSRAAGGHSLEEEKRGSQTAGVTWLQNWSTVRSSRRTIICRYKRRRTSSSGAKEEVKQTPQDTELGWTKKQHSMLSSEDDPRSKTKSGMAKLFLWSGSNKGIPIVPFHPQHSVAGGSVLSSDGLSHFLNVLWFVGEIYQKKQGWVEILYLKVECRNRHRQMISSATKSSQSQYYTLDLVIYQFGKHNPALTLFETHKNKKYWLDLIFHKPSLSYLKVQYFQKNPEYLQCFSAVNIMSLKLTGFKETMMERNYKNLFRH